MDRFNKFLTTNRLKKGDIADYLGVSRAFITQLSSGQRKLPDDKLALIKANAHGWDVSMLESDSKRGGITLLKGLVPTAQVSTEAKIRRAVQEAFNPEEQFVIRYLERKIKDLESKIDEKNTLINQLYKDIGALEHKLELARKGEIASPVAGSSDVDAV